MNLLTSLTFINSKQGCARQIISNEWPDCEQILQKDVNLFCWKRPVNLKISEYLEKLLVNELPPIKLQSGIHQIDQKIAEARCIWDQKPSIEADLFWEDISFLTRVFLSLSEEKSGTIHLKIIDNNACSKFHIDGYSLRLFTTYYGKGTLWLPEIATNRKGLGKSNDLIVKDHQQIQQMDSFEVGILKGEVPGIKQSVKGIVHKSPEILLSGEKRIILRVDI